MSKYTMVYLVAGRVWNAAKVPGLLNPQAGGQ